MTRSPDSQLARQWRQRLARFEHSDLTIAEFCEREGYSTASFYLWRRKLRGSEPSHDPAFIPVQIDGSGLTGRGGGTVEIDLPGGAVVKVPSDATTDEKRELIAAIIQATSLEGTS
ncbi:MAG: hypothetical protein AAFY56_18750 [Pseudomonadota bacterium]